MFLVFYWLHRNIDLAALTMRDSNIANQKQLDLANTTNRKKHRNELNWMKLIKVELSVKKHEKFIETPASLSDNNKTHRAAIKERKKWNTNIAYG